MRNIYNIHLNWILHSENPLIEVLLAKILSWSIAQFSWQYSERNNNIIPFSLQKKATKIASSTAFILVVNEDFLYFLQKKLERISDYIHFTHTRGMWKPHRAYTHSYTYKACIHLCTYSIWFYFFSYVIFRHKLLAAKYKYTYLIQEFLSTYSQDHRWALWFHYPINKIWK